MKVDFRDKTVLITGASSGIGEAIAYQFAKRGTNTIVTGLGLDLLEKVKTNCEQYGVKSYPFEIDLENKNSLDALVAYIGEQHLNIDFIVLNAGISQRALTLDSDFSIDEKLMNINYFGAVYLTKKLKKYLLEPSHVTHIAVNTSIAGLFGFPMRSAYSSSKHALFGFFESLALEYDNIKVTFIIPGRVNTQISKSAITANGEKYNKMDPGQAKGLDVTKCAQRALRAISKEKHKQLIGKSELLMAYIYKYAPSLYYRISKKISAV